MLGTDRTPSLPDKVVQKGVNYIQHGLLQTSVFIAVQDYVYMDITVANMAVSEHLDGIFLLPSHVGS